MRHITSCSICRCRKKRCIRVASDSACAFCSVKDLHCDLAPTVLRKLTTYARREDHTTDLARIDTPRSGSRNEIRKAHEVDLRIEEVLRLSLCHELIELYFDLFHNKQQILFHHQTFLFQHSKNLVPDYILLGIVALVARFSRHDYFQNTAPLNRGKQYLYRALELFNSRNEMVSTDALQGCIMLSFVCFVENQSDQSSLLASQATCMVRLLKLPDRPTTCAIEKEIDIRLFWQAWMMDTWNASRNRSPGGLNPPQELPKPPMEEAFEMLSPYDPAAPGSFALELRQPSLWGEVVKLTDLLAQVLQVVKNLVEQHHTSIQLEVKTQTLASQLNHWNQSLPEYLQDTSENREIFKDLGKGREFAVLHLIYHYQSLILFFPYLTRYPDCNDTALVAAESFCRPPHKYANLCKSHAHALSHLMWTTNTTAGMECLWSPVNGHLLVIASTVLLHSLLFDQSPPGLTHCTVLLEQNYVMLLQMQRYWPTLKYSLSRLSAIHKACERGYGLGVFKVDAWMLSFLSDYDGEITERYVETDQQEQLMGMPQGSPRPVNLNWPKLTGKAMDSGSELSGSLTFDSVRR